MTERMTLLQFRKEMRVSLEEFVEMWVREAKGKGSATGSLEMETFEDWIEEFLKWEDIDPQELKAVASKT